MTLLLLYLQKKQVAGNMFTVTISAVLL